MMCIRVVVHVVIVVVVSVAGISIGNHLKSKFIDGVELLDPSPTNLRLRFPFTLA